MPTRRAGRLLATVLSVTVALCGILLGGCATNPVTGEQDLVLVSESQELALGQQAHQQTLQQYRVYNDAALQQYVDAVGQRLAAVSHRQDLRYTFTLLDSTEINAFALPGGFIYLTRGLLAYMNSEAELAAVLGHEIGHVVFRHGMQRMRRDLGLRTAIQGLLSDHGNMAKLAQVGASFRGLSFGRVHEDESDAFGMELAYQAGFDPSGAPNLWKRMQEKFGSGSGIQGYLSTHPSNEARINNTLAWLKRKGVPYRQTGGGKSYTGP